MPPARTGHIERLPSGSYRAHVYAGTDPLTGKAIYLRATAKTVRQAQVELGRLLDQAAIGKQPELGVTVGQLLDQYMQVAELDVSTRESYEGYIRRTIRPVLGGKQLRKVRGPMLDTFYARLRRCSDLSCTGRAFTEHRNFPVLAVQPDDPRPAWQQIADTISGAICAGRLMSGESLPSVRELASHQDLRIVTLQHAFAVLATDGVIAVRQGRRAVVAGQAGSSPLGRNRPGDTSHDCARAGCKPHQCRPMSPQNDPEHPRDSDGCLLVRRSLGVDRSQPGCLRQASQGPVPPPVLSQPRRRCSGDHCSPGIRSGSARAVPLAGGHHWRPPR